MARYCKRCNQEGHQKWLFLGTHFTHRLYLHWQLRKTIRRAKALQKTKIKNLNKEDCHPRTCVSGVLFDRAYPEHCPGVQCPYQEENKFSQPWQEHFSDKEEYRDDGGNWGYPR